jgi:hypothetical protein
MDRWISGGLILILFLIIILVLVLETSNAER